MTYAEQLSLFPEDEAMAIRGLDSRLWHGSFNKIESSVQQLSPYIGKMKSGMAKVLLALYSRPGDIILDPFSGSGVVPLEAVLAGRVAWANDLSVYAYTLTRGKLEAPGSEPAAVAAVMAIMDESEKRAASVNMDAVPEWVRGFFHPQTLREVIAAFEILREQEQYFLMACLLGILHHVRPGFLSYPASHLVPYLRTNKYPEAQYPAMYRYRDVRSRLLAKVRRAYRRPQFPASWEKRSFRVWQSNAMNLPVGDHQVDAIISSPPYFGALDYARDNRLRLWFLGCEDWKQLDASLTANKNRYVEQMAVCLQEMDRVLKPGKFCVLVLGDVERDGKTQRTAEILADLASEVTRGRMKTELIFDDLIPDDRRSRRLTRTTKYERILVMRKRS